MKITLKLNYIYLIIENLRYGKYVLFPISEKMTLVPILNYERFQFTYNFTNLSRIYFLTKNRDTGNINSFQYLPGGVLRKELYDVQGQEDHQ